MSYLEAHEKELYELRFSPMCKPAAEVANLTQLEKSQHAWACDDDVANCSRTPGMGSA